MHTLLIFFIGFLSFIAPARSKYILIKGGTVVNADQEFQADILIHQGLIASIKPSIPPLPSYNIINATGKYVMPGGIDVHTHLDMPFMGDVTADDFYTGHVAALSGGTTYHIDFALPINHDLIAGFNAWKEKASEKAVMDYSFHMAVTSWSDQVAQDMETLTKHGINSFKFFMAYKGALMVTDEELIKGLQRCKALQALPQVHAENGDAVEAGQRHVIDMLGITAPHGHGLSRPALVEAEATSRAIRLAEFVGVPIYIVHVMSEDAMEEIARAKKRGATRVIGETVTSALALNDLPTWSSNFTLASSMIMSPPLRGPGHADSLRKSVAGGILEIIGTDHAPFNSTQKAAGKGDFRKIPNGVNGIEERMHVLWHEMVGSQNNNTGGAGGGLLTRSDFVRVTSTRPAQVFNIYPQKALIAEGSDADIILLDPTIEHTLGVGSHHYARMDTNVYEGKKVKGKVTTTISRGRVVWHDGEMLVGAKIGEDNIGMGSGRFIPLRTGGRMFEGMEGRGGAAEVEMRKREEMMMGRGGGAMSETAVHPIPNQFHDEL